MSADQLSNLDNTDFSDPSIRINSPKSIEACRRLGIEPRELYQVPFEEFVAMNPEIKGIPKELQMLRYGYFEKTRSDNIKNCREERERIIDGMRKFEEGQFQRSISLSQTSKSAGLSGFNRKSPSMDNEQRGIEKLKMRQKAEVENLIDQELKLEMMRKENEQKEMMARMKEERMKEYLKRKQMMQEETKRQREIMKQYQTEKEYEELQKRLAQKNFEEQMKKEFLAEKNKRKQLEMMMKKEIQMQKTKEKKMNSERMFMDQQRRTIEKQIMMEEREKFRKAYEEQKNYYKKLENERMKEIQQAKINEVKDMMEQKIMRQKYEMDRKEQLVEQRKKFFEMQHKMAQQMPRTAENFDPSRSLDGISQTLPPNKKREKVKLAKMKHEWEQMMKSNAIIGRLDEIEHKIKWKEQQKEQYLMLKNEINSIKKEEFKNKLKKREKVQDYYRELNVRKLREKEERAQAMKMQKQAMLEYKKSVQDQNSKQKKQVIELFDKMMRNSNSISPDMILEMFPGEQHLINKLMMLKEVTRSSSPMARSYNQTEGNQWNQSKSLNNSFQNSI